MASDHPDHAAQKEHIDARFSQMLAKGFIEQIRALQQRPN
jgi:tRNA A37 N6-isopentenylltransferase MiaA